MPISNSVAVLSDDWVDVFAPIAKEQGGCINYETFSRAALFHPELGYYSDTDRLRVGKSSKADFYTSTSHSLVFPELVLEAAASLLTQHLGINSNSSSSSSCSSSSSSSDNKDKDNDYNNDCGNDSACGCNCVFFEIGAEPGQDQWKDLIGNNRKPIPETNIAGKGNSVSVEKYNVFKDYKILRLGDSDDIRIGDFSNPFSSGHENEPLFTPASAPVVIFSNELFDAQPFFRWISKDGVWKPIHLKLEGNKLTEVLGERVLTEGDQGTSASDLNNDKNDNNNELASMKLLPPAPLGIEYHLDVSIEAQRLAEKLIRPNWRGLFLAFDYGMMWKQMVEETPQGTARAYHQHQHQLQQVNAKAQHTQKAKLEVGLHLDPGQKDLTTHVCWDPLMDLLKLHGFSPETIQLRTQSRFFMEESKGAIERIVTGSHTLVDQKKSQLLELISPGFFGQKFQVLSAIRK